MKMRKLIGIAAAAVIGFSAAILPAAAEKETEAEKSEKPAASSTVCFDTEKTLEYITTFGAADETDLSYRITSDRAYANASLAISESFSAGSGAKNAGIYFRSTDFGLDSLSGCTISLKVYAPISGADELSVYSDGDIFLSQKVAMTANPVWQTVTLTIPESVDNQMFGVLITGVGPVKGDVCNIDELCLYKPNGEMAENIGDFKVVEDSSSSGFNRVLMIIVFVLLLIAVLGCCAYFLLKFVVWRYR